MKYLQPMLGGVAIAAALSACVNESIVAVSPRAANIKIVREDEKPFRCDAVGDVHGTSRSTDQPKARQGAENDIKNQAAKLKANYVLLEADRGGKVGMSNTYDAFLGGKALRCPEKKED